jgi:hypothetical protein
MTYAQIGLALGIPESTAASICTRAMRKIQRPGVLLKAMERTLQIQEEKRLETAGKEKANALDSADL